MSMLEGTANVRRVLARALTAQFRRAASSARQVRAPATYNRPKIDLAEVSPLRMERTSPNAETYIPRLLHPEEKKLWKREAFHLFPMFAMVSLAFLLAMITSIHHLVYDPEVLVDKKKRAYMVPPLDIPQWTIVKAVKYIFRSPYRRFAYEVTGDPIPILPSTEDGAILRAVKNPPPPPVPP